MLHDMMPQFELYQPDTIENALKLAKDLDDKGWIIAGGYDSLDWFKDRAKRPARRHRYRRDREPQGHSRDGRRTRDRRTHHAHGDRQRIRWCWRSIRCWRVPRVTSRARRSAMPARIGGNLCQDARCWYYRSGVNCYRAGGNSCYADTPQGQNREHCLFGASRCVAVSPSDIGTASVALDAHMVVHSASGEKVIPAEEFFIGPATDITHMTVLKKGEILTAVRFPKEWAGAKFYFEKVTDRNTWDFALVSVAAAMILDGGMSSRRSVSPAARWNACRAGSRPWRKQ